MNRGSLMDGRYGGFLVEEDGSELIEFSLSLSILCLLLFGILGFARAMYVYTFVGFAVRDATRYAMVRGSSYQGARCTTVATMSCTASESDIAAYVKSTVTQGIDPAALTILTSWPGKNVMGSACNVANGKNSQGCIVSVSASYAIDLQLPFVTKQTLLLKSSSSTTIAQ